MKEKSVVIQSEFNANNSTTLTEWASVFLGALLTMNLFKVLFTPFWASSGICGTLLRPVLDVEDEELPIGSILDTSPFFYDDDLFCPRGMYFLWGEFLSTIFALLLCVGAGFLARRKARAQRNKINQP